MTNLSIVKSFHGEGLEKIELILFIWEFFTFCISSIYKQVRHAIWIMGLVSCRVNNSSSASSSLGLKLSSISYALGFGLQIRRTKGFS